jgi:hypothetical protein
MLSTTANSPEMGDWFTFDQYVGNTFGNHGSSTHRIKARCLGVVRISMYGDQRSHMCHWKTIDTNRGGS